MESLWAAFKISPPKEEGRIKVPVKGTGNPITTLSEEELALDEGRPHEDEPIENSSYASSNKSSGVILFDSDCSIHITPLEDQLKNIHNTTKHVIQAANGETFSADTAGLLHLDIPTNNASISLLPLQQTLLCPNIPNTLVSLGKLDNAGYSMHIKNSVLNIFD